jgi:Skp family chaperone for outer membrane proteins
VKKLIAFLTALVALAGIMHVGSWTTGPQALGQAAAPQRSKIALVNIAKVLRNFNKATAAGKELADLRADFIARMNKKRGEIAERQQTIAKSPATAASAAERDKLEKEITQLQREIQDLDRDAQKKLGTMSNDTIVRVYQDIKGIIEAIAVANGMELVLCYPDATLPTEENTPSIAQLKLQTPAAMPFYQRQLDITDAVIQTLNARNPVAAPAAPAAAPAAAPMQ